MIQTLSATAISTLPGRPGSPRRPSRPGRPSKPVSPGGATINPMASPRWPTKHQKGMQKSLWKDF